jgi:hypothetical protein
MSILLRPIYALGPVIPRFPRLSLEKLLLQGMGQSDTAGFADREALYKVLSARENRYLSPRVLANL